MSEVVRPFIEWIHRYDLVAGISICYPWRQEQPFAPKLVHLPLLLTPLWIAYEVLMPDYMDIRVDLFSFLLFSFS
jgi:hypothetical protein